MPALTLSPADAHSGMVRCWAAGDRYHAGLLARVLLRDLSVYTRRVWLVNAVSIRNATRDQFPGEAEDAGF